MTNQRLLVTDNPGNKALLLQVLGEQAPSNLYVPVALVLQFGKARARPSFDDVEHPSIRQTAAVSVTSGH